MNSILWNFLKDLLNKTRVEKIEIKLLRLKIKSFSSQICGVENLATADPDNSFTLNDGRYHSDFSYVCRFDHSKFDRFSN